jgi:hypothetical protein
MPMTGDQSKSGLIDPASAAFRDLKGSKALPNGRAH